MNAGFIAALSAIAGLILIFFGITKRDYLNEKGAGMTLPILLGFGLIVNGAIIFVKN